MQKAEDTLVRAREAARILAIGRTTFWSLVRDGKIKKIKLGQRAVGYRRSDLDALIEQAANRE
jgi:excisionase family DNA binding protein